MPQTKLMQKILQIKIVVLISFCVFNVDANQTKLDQRDNYKIALLINKTEHSTSSSNFQESNQENGLNLAIKNLPSNSKKIIFYKINVGETAQGAISAFEEIKKLNVDVIIGPSHSFQVEIIAKKLELENITAPIVSPSATSSELEKYKNVWLISNTNRKQANILTEEIKKNSPKLVQIIDIVDCSYCSNLAKELSKSLSLKKIKNTTIMLENSTIDSNQKIKNNLDSDDIVVPGLEANTAAIIKILFTSNPKARYWAGDGVGSTARFVKNLSINKLRFSWLTHYDHRIPYIENKYFVNQYFKEYGHNPIDTSANYHEALRFAINQFILNKRFNHNFCIYGPCKLESRRLLHPMVLLDLENNFKIVGQHNAE